VDERGAVGIRLEPAAEIVRQYGEQFRARRASDGWRNRQRRYLASVSVAGKAKNYDRKRHRYYAFHLAIDALH
jgi:hypothetical protein